MLDIYTTTTTTTIIIIITIVLIYQASPLKFLQ